MWKNLLLIAGAVPMLVLVAAVSFHRWKFRRSGARLPFGEKLLRPPGYSLTRQLSALDDDFITWVLAGFICALMSVGTWRFAPSDFYGELMWLGFFGLVAAISTVATWRAVLWSTTINLPH